MVIIVDGSFSILFQIITAFLLSLSIMSITEATPPTPVDIASLSTKVRHYLKSNQITWSRFSSLVLGVTQSRLSTLLGKPKPWHQLTRRVQALYERMQLWMDTRATYGNNPYCREKTAKKNKNKKMKSCATKKPRSLFEGKESLEMLKQLEDYAATQGLLGASVEEAMATNEVVEIQQEDSTQVVVEDGVVQDDMAKLLQEYNQMAMEGEVTLVRHGVEDQKVVEDNMFIYQMGDQGVSQSEMPMCQVVVEDNPEEPGTYKLSIVQVACGSE